ncbi:MAG: T9SS type A sorting domain-containing protein [Bacteroidia bacterium]|nr:T9SS type A sorting domain-containing protein [Bacteroidia bacterium]
MPTSSQTWQSRPIIYRFVSTERSVKRLLAREVHAFCYLLALSVLLAQPLPDQITLTTIRGETIRGVCRTFAGGWAAELYRQEGGDWVAIRRDSFFVDSLLRLVHLRQYVIREALLTPYKRYRLDYPQSNLLICTREDYDTILGGFVPQERFYLWGASVRHDSVMRGWLGLLGLGWNNYDGAMLVPHPILSDLRLWGDSLLIESFLPESQVFVAIAGYKRSAGSPCDTIYTYSQQGIQLSLESVRQLCIGTGGRLVYTYDTACTPSGCAAERRFLFYDAQEKPVKDSLALSLYTLQGNPQGTTLLTRRYAWDGQGRLIRAEYPNGVYELIYGQQVVALSSASPNLHYWRGRLWGMPPGAPVALYDMQGRLIWASIANFSGELDLPETCPTGLYLLRWGESQLSLIHHAQ